MKIIKKFLKIKCPINKAANELNKFFKKYKVNLVKNLEPQSLKVFSF